MAHSSERPYYLSTSEKNDLKELFAERFDPLMDTLPPDNFNLRDAGKWFSKHRSRILLASLMFFTQAIPDTDRPKIEPSFHPAPTPMRNSFIVPMNQTPIPIIITRQFSPLLPPNNP